MFKVFLMFSLTLLFTYGAVHAETGESYVANVLSLDATKHNTVVVDKVASKIYVLEVNGNSQKILREAPVITGLNAGSKEVEGDKKTPEGVYFIRSYMSSERMHTLYGDYADIYGSGAYPLNYPNPIDRIKKRTGGGIWIHGLNPLGHKPNTDGCVGMENVDFDNISTLLSIGMPVVLLDNVTLVSEADYTKEREHQLGILDNFLEAWSGGDYESFASYVHPEYRSYAARNAKAYLASKEHLMKLYPQKQVKADDINIYVQTDNTALYDFNQFYCAPNIVSYSNKRIYLATDEDKYKIISEEIQQKDLAPYLEPHLEDFVEKWRLAWESADIDSYMAYYGSSFPSINKWREHKNSTFAASSKINVGVDGINWSKAGGDTVRISFTQTYSSDTISDKGHKTLIIQGCPGGYKIISEDWRAL